MGIGTSLILIAVGAVLRFAISVNAHGINLHTVGVILMIVGAAGLLLSLFYTVFWTERGVDAPPPESRRVVRDPRVDPRL
jgi:hypothetical protein